MKSVNSRSMRSQTDATMGTIGRLVRRVGRAMGLAGHGADAMMFDRLEDRRMLEGSFATAIAITLDLAGNGSSTGAINPADSPTDNDYYKFTAPANDFVRILADTANETTTSTINTRVTVYGSANFSDIVATGTTNGALTSGLQRDGWAGFIAEAGREYFVVVSSDYAPGVFPSLPFGNTYTLTVGAVSTAVSVANDKGIGVPLTPVPPPGQVPPLQGVLSRRQEDTMFRYVAPAGDAEFNSLVTLNAQFNNYNPPNLPNSTIPDRLDTRIEVYSATGVFIASDSDAGRINDAFATFKATPGATYYIRVRSDEVRPRNASDPAFDVTLATGEFFLLLDAKAQPITLDRVVRRNVELAAGLFPVDDPLIPSSLPTPVFQTGLYSFVAQGDGVAFVTINPNLGSLTPLTDPAVRLYDSAGNQLAFNDNYSGTAAELQIRVVGGQTYFFVVDGFELNSLIDFFIDIESNHTDNTSADGTRVDDHVDTPTLGQNPTPAEREAARLQFQQATGLNFGSIAYLTDADNNVIRDRGGIVTAQATGRIWTNTDTDLFQFMPQVDHLINYDGNNDDAGTSLFIGGRFEAGDPASLFPTTSRNVTIWDAGDYFYAGRQDFDPNFGVTYGFRDNPATPGTNGPEIYVMEDWDPLTPAQAPQGMNRRRLVVGGDFELVIPTAQGPQVLTNLAVWRQNFNTGRFFWQAFGNPDAPVRAATTFDPTPWSNNPNTTLPADNRGPALVIGGDFTTVNGIGASRVAFFSSALGWHNTIAPGQPGVQITTGSVMSLQVHNPNFQVQERAANPGPPVLTLVEDVPQTPPLLFIGGQFSHQGAAVNIAVTDGFLGVNRLGNLFHSISRGAISDIVNGPVRAMAAITTTEPDAENPGEFVENERLFLAGAFSSAGGVAVQNIARFGRTAGIVDPEDPNYNPFAVFDTFDLGGNSGIGGATINALQVWDPPDINGGTIDPILVIGGAFTGFQDSGGTFRNNLVGFDPIGLGTGWFNAGSGPGGVVRSLTTLTDAQEPGIPENLRTGNPQEVLYVGGEFQTVVNGNQTLQASRVVQYAAFRGLAADFFSYSVMAGGVGNIDPAAPTPVAVFALSGFDDGNPLEWDRHDRPATRLGISVSGVDGSFINARVRVFDSNFNLLYTNDTIAPPFPDPAGMIDPSTAGPPLVDQALRGIRMWAGETYYIEVADVNTAGTGRYQMTVTMDGLPIDINNDGVLDDINSTYAEEPDEGAFTSAILLPSPLGTGDYALQAGSATLPLKGFQRRVQKFNPGTMTANGGVATQFVTVMDLGNIESVSDNDLFSFRAQFSGMAEIRLTTTALPDQFGEAQVDSGGNILAFRGEEKTYNSLLDGVLRVYRNDFEQIAYSDDNPALAGESDFTQVGTLPQGATFRFFERDPRVVIPVIAGNLYFIQVENGQRYRIGNPAVADQRTPNIPREVDPRYANGSYQLIVNAMPSLDNDVENGQTVQDDHSDFGTITTATPIAIGERAAGRDNGLGSITGAINNTPLKPQDSDHFFLIAPGNATNGQMTITLSRTTGSTLVAELLMQNLTQGGVFAGTPTSNGGLVVTANAQKGDQIIIRVRGSGASEGGYRLDVAGIPQVDDHSSPIKVANATTLTLRDFLGQGTATGVIDAAGDVDLFRFSFETFYSALTITVTAQDPTLNPVVSVYEYSEDPTGEPILLRVALNNDAAANSTTARVIVPITPDRETDLVTGIPRDYPYYYIRVEGLNPEGDFGRYTLTATFTPTDDHPDGDTDADGNLDTGEYTYASRIVIDSDDGEGTSNGFIERPEDSDLFVFTAPAGGPATVTVSRQDGSILRARITILDANGVIIATAVADDTSSPSTATVAADVTRNQDYYVVVQPFEDTLNPNTNTDEVGLFTVTVNAPPIDDHPNAGEFDLADAIFFNTATGIATLGGSEAGDPANSRLNPTGDTDLITFTTILSGNHTIRLTPFNAGGGFIPTLTLFNSDRVQIAQVVGSTALQALQYTIVGAAQAARYYVLITAVNDGVTPRTGEYGMTVTGPVPTGETGGPDASAIDFNNPIALALNPGTGFGSRFDTINPINDRDLFTFTSLAAGRVFVQVTIPSGSILDASVRVLSAVPTDSNGNGKFDDSELAAVQVAGGFDADGIPGATAALSFDANAGTQYWIVVDGLGESTGSYEVRVKGQPQVNTLYFPEGFSNSNIREFLSIVNPNNTAVNYTLYARYEFGAQLQSILAVGTIPALSRGGETITDGASYVTPGLLQNIPYSLVLESDKPLGATLAHYDFGNAIGDSMTETTSATWNFARVERNPGLAQDYIVFYNPNNFEVNVTIRAYQGGVEVASLSRNFGALRRGGFSINDIENFPLGKFSVKLESTPVNSANIAAHIGVVASISHYTPGGAAGWATLGDPSNGSTHGAITNVTQGPKVSSELTFFNPGLTSVIVTLTGSYTRATLPSFSRSFEIAPKSQVTLDGNTLGLVVDQTAGVTWRASGPIVANSNQTQQGDADSAAPSTVAGTRFRFGDAFIETSNAGRLHLETLYIYNPTAFASTITINLVFFDGSTAAFTTTVRARGFGEVRLHERPEIIQQHTGPVWFGVDMAAPLPFAVSMVHYDLAINGGWATAGIPLGLTNSLASIP